MSAADLAAAARALAGELRRRRRWGARRTAGLEAPAEAAAPPATRAPAASAHTGQAPSPSRPKAPAPAPPGPRTAGPEVPRPIPKPTVRRADLPAADPAALDMPGLRQAVSTCLGCRLSAGAAGSGALVGRGSLEPRILYVTDFAGPAERACGKVLAPELGRMMADISKALGTGLDRIYATAAVKCPLPSGAVPSPAELAACRRWLARELELVRPTTVVAFGSLAAKALFGPEADFEGLRGRLLTFNEVPTVVTQPPRDMHADRSLKGRAWKELQLLGPALGVSFD